MRFLRKRPKLFDSPFFDRESPPWGADLLALGNLLVIGVAGGLLGLFIGWLIWR